MLKEPIEISFFAIQANFPFTDTNSTEAKFGKDPFNQQKQFSQKTFINKTLLQNIKKKDIKFMAIYVIVSTLYFLNIFSSLFFNSLILDYFTLFLLKI